MSSRGSHEIGGGSDAIQMRRKPKQARSQKRIEHVLDVADRLFAEVGFESATTIEIAARAETSIGALYRFFPDKVAILNALAARYIDQIHELFAELHRGEAVQQPLAVYVEEMIDTFNQFVSSKPGFLAIFGQNCGITPEVSKMKQDFDKQLIQELADFYKQRNPNLSTEDLEVVSLVAFELSGSLFRLALSRDELTKNRVIAEAKRVTFMYLQFYLSETHPSCEQR